MIIAYRYLMPTSAQPRDPLLRAQQRLGRDPAEQHQLPRLRQRDVAQHEGQEERDLGIRRRAVPRRAEGQDVGDVEILGRGSSPIEASIRSSNWPETPTKGRPSRSSSPPGASPISIRPLSGTPSAKTRLVAVSRSGLASNSAMAARSAGRLSRLRRQRRGAGGAGRRGARAGRASGLRLPPALRRHPRDGRRERSSAGGGGGRRCAARCGRSAPPPAPRPPPSRSAAGAPPAAPPASWPPACRPLLYPPLYRPAAGFRASRSDATSGGRPGGARHVRR